MSLGMCWKLFWATLTYLIFSLTFCSCNLNSIVDFLTLFQFSRRNVFPKSASLYWMIERKGVCREGAYSLSRKTVNTRENFWNVYCFATNQMRNETANDNRQTAAGISHDLIRNNQLVHSSTRNLQFSLCITLKSHFYHKLTLVTWFRLLKNQTTELTVQIVKIYNGTGSRHGQRFLSYQKLGSKTTNHSQVAWSFELHVKQTQRNIACDWLIFSRSQTRCLAVSDRLILPRKV